MKKDIVVHLDKKTFLQQGSALYAAMIDLAGHDVVRRYLAARIVVNAMAFEDLVGDRQDPQLRHTRNVLLAHKQEPGFLESYQGFEEIKRGVIEPHLQSMQTAASTPDTSWLIGELQPGTAKDKFQILLPKIFREYEQKFISGPRVINNPLGSTGNSVQEVSGGELAGVFYRYNAAKSFFELAQRIFKGAHPDPALKWTVRHAKLDMLLHAQNMADSAIRDRHNSHSIDGLLEVMTKLPMGDASSLNSLTNDQTFKDNYTQVRKVRNKLIAHMEKTESLNDLTMLLDQLPDSAPFDLANAVELAVRTAAFTHPAIRARYGLANHALNDSSIIGVDGLPPVAF